MKFLELETQRKIYNHIGKNPGVTLRGMLNKLNIDPSKIQYHLNQMLDDELIFLVQNGGGKQYYLKNLKIGLRDKRILEVRRKIYDVIMTYPGLHLSKIARILDIRISLTEYHLHCMEKDELIYGIKEKGYIRYYIKDSEIGIREKKILSLFRQKLPFQIVLYLLKNSYARHCDIANSLKVSTSRLSYHLDKLVELGIVIPPDHNSTNGYAIKDKKEIKSFIHQYRLQSVKDPFSET